MREKRLIRGLLAVGAALALGAALFSCGAARAAVPSASPPEAAPSEPGSWYLLEGDGLRESAGPAAAGVPFLPWTVQMRVADFLQVGGRLFVAVNARGLIALPADPLRASQALYFDARALFAGRTINGLYAEGKEVVVDLYRNTLFGTTAPASPPVSLVRVDPAAGRILGAALPLTASGWEAADVVRLPDGRWSIAWKRTTASRVEFRYELYAPRSGTERPITRAAFLSSYGYRAIDEAPQALRRIDARARELFGKETVIDYLVKRPDLTWIARYRSGPVKKLFAGEADLETVPVFREGGAFFALVAGRLIRAGSDPTEPRALPLPALPEGYAYTDLWSDGRTLVVSWERQRFTEVGAAGLYVRALPPVSAGKGSPPGRGHER